MSAKQKIVSLLAALALVVSLCAVVAVPVSGLTVTAVTATPNTAGAAAQFTITGTLGAAITAGVHTVSVTFPPEATVPATISKDYITLNGTSPSVDPTVSGNTVTFLTPSSLAAGAAYTIVISQLAGIKNPTVAGTYSVSVVTSAAGETSGSANYTVTRKLSLNPTSGPRGTTVTVTGVGFAPNTTVSLTVPGGSITSADVGGDGSFMTTFDVSVPPFGAGANTITATDGAGGTATATFTLEPGITLDPTSGMPGSSVTIKGRDFAGATIPAGNITIATLPCTYTAPITITGGAFTATVTLPTTVTPGDKVIRVIDNAGNSATAIFTVTGRPVTLTPAEGVRGTKVTIQGSNFTPGGTIPAGGITFAGAGWNTAAINIDSAGNFITQLTVPATAAAGSNTVTVTDAAGLSGTAVFTVKSASFSLEPTSSVRGSWVVAKGSGFAANSTVTIAYAGTTVATASTDASGNFTVRFKVPSTAGIGTTNTVTATDSSGPPAVTKSATHEVPGASISVSPSEAKVGETITITGTGFPAYSAVSALTIAGISALPVPQPATDALGSFTADVVVPAAPVGPTIVTATAGGITASVTFTVRAAPVTVATALATVSDKLVRVWGFDAATQSWKLYDPAAPEVSDLASLEKGKGYWIQVSEDCTLIYGGNTYELKAGWNLIGWLG